MKKCYLLLISSSIFISTASAQWALTGNSITSGQYLGTNNAQNLVFKASNINAGLIDVSYSNTYFGLYTGGTITSTTTKNSGFGMYALQQNTSGYANTAVGYLSLPQNSSGANNCGFGEETLYDNTTGYGCNAIGGLALYYNTTGNFNTGVGLSALMYNTTGSHNVGIGDSVLTVNTTGSQNTAIGDYAGSSTSNLTNASAFGYNATVNASNKVVIGNTSVTSIGGYVGWTNFSDGRYKKNIQENVPGLTFINLLRPVTYTIDISGLNNSTLGEKKVPASAIDQNSISQKEKIVYTGFVAQEVEASAKKANYDFSGVVVPQNDKDLYGLRYSDFVVPVVKAVQELSKTNDSLKLVVDSLKTAQRNLQSEVNDIVHQLNLFKAMTDVPVLKQNFPNPFKGTTTINYYLPKIISNAQLTITDGQGHVLKDVALSNSKGQGQAIINAGDLSSGTYFYSLVINGKNIDTKKMILTK